MPSPIDRSLRQLLLICGSTALTLVALLLAAEAKASAAPRSRQPQSLVSSEPQAAPVNIMQSDAQTITIWSILKQSWSQTAMHQPPPTLYDVAANVCAHPMSVRINEWAVSSQFLEISSSLYAESAAELVVVKCDEQLAPWIVLNEPVKIIDPTGKVQVLEQGGDELVWLFAPEIESPLGIYQLVISDDHLRNIAISVQLSSSGRVFAVDKNARIMQQRFSSLADVTLLGHGFKPRETMTVALAVAHVYPPYFDMSPLGSWELTVDSEGAFTTTIAEHVVRAAETAGQATPTSGLLEQIVPGSAPATPDALFVVVLCSVEDCQLTPRFNISGQGRVHMAWPAFYATTFCADSSPACYLDRANLSGEESEEGKG